MSLTLKVNFLKGWPSPAIAEKVASTAATTLDQGMIGRLDESTGKWVLGVSGVNQVPYVFRNAYGDPDAGRASTNVVEYVQPTNLGGIQGISFNNAIEFETVQYGGADVGSTSATPTPAVGDQLYADTDGKLKVGKNLAGTATAGVTGKPLVAVVTQAPHGFQGSNYISVVPLATRVVNA